MKRFPFPIIVPNDVEILITQGFADTSNLDFYRSRGIKFPFHNGVDFRLSGHWSKSYGSALITPSEGWRIVKVNFDSPLSTKGNGVTIQSGEFVEDGLTKMLQVVFWHASEVERHTGELPAYTPVAYMGNSGIVRPEPSVLCVYCGTHCHLMLFEFHKASNGGWELQNSDNGVGGAIDPLTRFDPTWVIRGKDTSIEKDLPPFQWALDIIKEQFKKLWK